MRGGEGAESGTGAAAASLLAVDAASPDWQLSDTPWPRRGPVDAAMDNSGLRSHDEDGPPQALTAGAVGAPML
jgi:hypothetical protein